MKRYFMQYLNSVYFIHDTESARKNSGKPGPSFRQPISLPCKSRSECRLSSSSMGRRRDSARHALRHDRSGLFVTYLLSITLVLAPTALRAEGSAPPPVSPPPQTGNSEPTAPQADTAQPKAQADTPESRKVIDPTVMSPRFREALRAYAPKTDALLGRAIGTVSAQPIPSIRIVGRVHGGIRDPHVYLQIGDGAPHLVKRGSTLSAMDGSLTMDVVDIAPDKVELLIPSLNKTIILR
jgi:hypothetical protein